MPEKRFLNTVGDEKIRNPDLVVVTFQKVLNPESRHEIHWEEDDLLNKTGDYIRNKIEKCMYKHEARSMKTLKKGPEQISFV